MVRFADYDSRHYRSVDVRSGYAEWAGSYEDTVEDEMDLALLERLREPRWTQVSRAADLACGSGRTGAWLAARGVGVIDGVDLTLEMLERAAARGVYERLVEADVAATGLPSGVYDLVVACLVDEHLEELAPLYREAGRLAAAGGAFVLVSLHPHFIIASGMATHFRSSSGEEVAITTHLHLLSEQIAAGLGAGLRLVEMREAVIDDRWVELKPRWEAYRGHPVSAALVWRRDDD
jgi:SAM-dependent methyltransferase